MKFSSNIMATENQFFITFSVIVLSSFLNCQDIGDPCPDGKPGVCARVQDCTSALKDIKLRKNPQLCSFKRQEPIICCIDKKLNLTKTSKMLSLNSVTGDMSAADLMTVEQILMFKNDDNYDECPPISVNLPAGRLLPKTAKKSFNKCFDYQKKYLYPCVDSPLLGQKKMRANFCTWSPESLITNGKNASRGEFPHMALLGFGTTKIDWKCGGTILSERFVLTAAHCTKIPHSGPVRKIKIGILKRSESDSKTNVYNVLKIHVHKGYHSPQKYNDIALLKTDREMLLNPFALPACLHDGAPVNDTEVIVTGWGNTRSNKKTPADNLQKAFLRKFQDSECIRFHKQINNRNILEGYDNQTQICFGDKSTKTDTCPGDSGGPVQIKHPRAYCMYLVLGVTSYGRSCGLIGEPGVYTRVSHYLPWIESIVWSDR